jgi:hypothetical protein
MTAPSMNTPVFQPWSWFDADNAMKRTVRAYAALELANFARDVASGAAAVLELLEHDRREEACEGDAVILAAPDSERLGRLAIVALQMLAREAEAATEGWQKGDRA